MPHFFGPIKLSLFKLFWEIKFWWLDCVHSVCPLWVIAFRIYCELFWAKNSHDISIHAYLCPSWRLSTGAEVLMMSVIWRSSPRMSWWGTHTPQTIWGTQRSGPPWNWRGTSSTSVERVTDSGISDDDSVTYNFIFFIVWYVNFAASQVLKRKLYSEWRTIILQF